MADYIDRNKLKEAFIADFQSLQTIDEHTANLMIIELEEAPAADVAPVVHGEWIEEKYQTISVSRGRTINNTKNCCSVCGNSNGRVKTSYCPHCGAKMDGGEKDAQVPT